MIRKSAILPAIALFLYSLSGCSSTSYSIHMKTYRGYPDGKGCIVGFISDRTTGDVLRGIVTLEGASYGAMSDDVGYYRISLVPAGKYYVNVVYIGYYPVDQPPVVVPMQS